MNTALILVLRFNAFTKRLKDGYLMNRESNQKVGATMPRKMVLEHLIAVPEAPCASLYC